MTISIFIENLKCGGCEAFIERKLRVFPAIRDVEIDGDFGEIKIDTDRPDERPLYVEMLTKNGYPEIGNNDFLSKARSYASCAIGRLTT